MSAAIMHGALARILAAVMPRLTFDAVFGEARLSLRGRLRTGPCPYCQEGGPTSLWADSLTLRWQTTCCRRHGGAIEFVNGGAAPGAAQLPSVLGELAARAGMAGDAVPTDLTSDDERYIFQWRIREELADWAGQQLADTTETESLLVNAGAVAAFLGEHPGTRSDALQRLGLGWYTTPAALREHLTATGFDDDAIESLGALLGDEWSGRLLLPVRDTHGVLVGFVGRATTEETANQDIFSEGAEPSSVIAYGLDVALRVHPDRGRILLVQDPFDATVLRARGMANACALGGPLRGLDTAQWRKLRDLGVREVTLAPDVDPAPEPCERHGVEGCRRCTPGLFAALDALEEAASVRGGRPRVRLLAPDGLGTATTLVGFAQEQEHDALEDLVTQRISPASFAAQVLTGHLTADTPSADRAAALENLERALVRLAPLVTGTDAEEAMRYVADRAGSTYETLFEDIEAKLRVEHEKERREVLELSLGQGQEALADGKSLAAVTATLKAAVDGAIATVDEEPPAFSVERLRRSIRDLPVGRPSGWKALDEAEVRFNPGELALIAARTGHGKTSFSVALLANWLFGKPAPGCDGDGLILFYSSEEPEEPVFCRLASQMTLRMFDKANCWWGGRDVMSYLRGAASDDQWPAAPSALDRSLDDLRRFEDRVMVIYRPRWSAEKIAAHARRMAARQPVAAVFVDYLQRLPPEEATGERRDIEVSRTARALKELAVDLRCPVVAAAQLNRESARGLTSGIEGNFRDPETFRLLRERRPELHHLREGGAEQEADLVLGLLNLRADFADDAAHGHDPVPEVTPLDVLVLKNRYGASGKVAVLAFHGKYQHVREVRKGECECVSTEQALERARTAVKSCARTSTGDR